MSCLFLFKVLILSPGCLLISSQTLEDTFYIVSFNVCIEHDCLHQVVAYIGFSFEREGFLFKTDTLQFSLISFVQVTYLNYVIKAAGSKLNA